MAILCADHDLLFIMAPHTGCTAVGETLKAELGGVFLPGQDIRDADGEVLVPRKHSQLGELMGHRLVTPAQRRTMVVASTIRNPFDALVSHYVKVHDRYTRDPDRRPASTRASRDFEAWLRYRFRPPLRARLRGRAPERPVRWTLGSEVVMRHERLQQDFDALMARVGVERRIQIVRTNVTTQRAGRPYQEFYTPGARRLVEDLYADDLLQYGYRFESEG